jgi:addiction module toxin, RelE/StbE family
MACSVIWSEAAIEDVESIAAYIAMDSEVYAAAVVRDISQKTRRLADFPLMGRTVPEFDDTTIREIFSYSYRIVYRIGQGTVTIAAIVHGSRLLELDLKP